MKTLAVIIGTALLFSCNSTPTANKEISKDEMYRIVRMLDHQFSVGVQKKDSALLVNIYSDSAQYVIPKRSILTGKSEIGKEWADFLRLKENPIDLILNIKDVSGNREIIYETGEGFTLLKNSSKWTFNYVNVWRLRKDGSYKLEIDTYN
jgi:ketosteroid isomerase-like protein